VLSAESTITANKYQIHFSDKDEEEPDQKGEQLQIDIRASKAKTVQISRLKQNP
jgi:hypothetical protein